MAMGAVAPGYRRGEKTPVRRVEIAKQVERFIAFFRYGEWAFLLGFLQKTWCRTWCFCGEVVVECVANVVN
jgi:hypothetical protein